MFLPLSWLNQYLDIDLSPQQIADHLTRLGLEVEGIQSSPLGFSGVIVCDVRSVQPHPEADKLQIADIFDGAHTVQVVCKDPRCRAGMKTAFAPVGAQLADATGKMRKMKKSKLRGVQSHGMLCSEQELGLSHQGDGIMSIDPSIAAGTPLETLYTETVLAISLTPNLGHCMSVVGIARELAALLDLPLTLPSFQLTEKGAPIDDAITLGTFDPDVRSYHCRVIRSCQHVPSPEWLQTRLKASGVRSVNALVDVTNYVMLDWGQPLHAFDLATLKEPTLCVRPTSTATPLPLLDGKTHTLPKGLLTVYAGTDPIAVAGVMGSAHSEVSGSTRDVLLEAAHFSPEAVRRASKALGIRSEASARFERGIDPLRVSAALDYAASLIAAITGGEVAPNSAAMTTTYTPRTLHCSVAKTNRLLGTTLSTTEIETLLTRLQMAPQPQDDDAFAISPPSYRNDITLDVDVIEEIARLFGYHHIPEGQATAFLSSLPHSPLFVIEKKVRHHLIAEGLQECITCNLISPTVQELFAEASLPSSQAIAVLKPSSQDQSILRTSLLPSLLHSVKANFNAKCDSLAFFEIGRTHFKEKGAYKERFKAAILLTGKTRPHHWEEKPRTVDFFDLKGVVENLFDALKIKKLTFTPSKLESFHPQKQAYFCAKGETIGSLGEVSPEKLLTLDIKQPLFFAEIDLIDLLDVIPHVSQMSPLPLYPASERDWTLTLPPTLSVSAVLEAIHNVPSKFFKHVLVLDLYEGKHLTLRLTYRNDQATIEHKQVEKEHTRIVDAVSSHLLQK